MKTWSGRGEDFSYTGSVAQGTEIIFGKNKNRAYISAEQYSELIKIFKGKTVEIGTSHDNPPRSSAGEWLQENVSKTQLSSCVRPIMISERYASMIGRSQICFNLSG